ncbi:hypothetical protein A0H81_06002 [Grifola frondosa]|uniref:Uncharacterized protein n=1 Tax=Grifola frondosa TaxID=5627 RepID=A0A1C7MC53_GRIFR|nr:hypothetical protein A0H81_06002 [Grifola frondosa]
MRFKHDVTKAHICQQRLSVAARRRRDSESVLTEVISRSTEEDFTDIMLIDTSCTGTRANVKLYPKADTTAHGEKIILGHSPMDIDTLHLRWNSLPAIGQERPVRLLQPLQPILMRA